MIELKRCLKNRAKNSLEIEFYMNVIYPYCEGDLLGSIKVVTLVVYATIDKTIQYDNNIGPKTPQKPS